MQGRLAQLGERLGDIEEVIGSSPIPPITEAPASPGVFVSLTTKADLLK
jgi:hypothetical protein